MINEKFKLNTPLPQIFPDGWGMGNQDFVSFRNLDHFRYTVAKLTQKNDNMCDMSYATALSKLLRGESDFKIEEQESIRNLVRSNLHKRGLITAEVYENYKYDVEGTNVGFDVGKYAAGEPDCVVTPERDYVDFFHELYVNISYPYNTENSTVRANIAKLLATIEELERRHIFIKITLVFPARAPDRQGERNFFSAIPLFSHKDVKSVKTMSAVVNDRLLRKFYFAILESTYGDNLCTSYGQATQLTGSMNVGNTFNEIEFYENVVEAVGAGEI